MITLHRNRDFRTLNLRRFWMNCLMLRPAEVQTTFWKKYGENPKAATDYFYKLSQDSNYIRRYRVKKDQKWTVDSEYGKLDITINLSKPEKDPKAIAAARNVKSGSYPKCLLCPENEGYAGRVNHPARQNHRIIPITINDSPWGFQYSPYVYYNEHCIVFNSCHTPMKIERNTFEKIAKHEDWVKELLEKYPDINAENIHVVLQKEVGMVFVHVLEDAGVYKCTPKGRENFMRFVDSL